MMMASWEPTEQVAVPSAQQRWRMMTFVHVDHDPDVVARLLPEPLEPDLFDGRAWVGVTPFQLEAAVLPVAPGPRSTHVEVNVRTYAVHPDGRDGIWFLSLELDQAVVAATLRTVTGLPYRWADTSLEDRGTSVAYRSRRHPPHRPGELELEVEVGAPLDAPPGSLETFLVGRWRAFTPLGGRLRHVPVEHEPWPLTAATLTSWRSEGFLAALDLPEPEGQPHVLFSPGVDARLGFPSD
jgi:uncharacterized protein YqjF (DUF2071 family)